MKEATAMRTWYQVAIALALLCLGIQSVYGTTITVTPTTATANPGEYRSFDLILDSAPAGLSGFNVTVILGNPSVGEITAVSFPAWSQLPTNASLPADRVWCKAVDLGGSSGTQNIKLITVTVRADSAGITSLTVDPQRVEDRQGGRYTPEIVPAILTVASGPQSPTVSSITPAIGTVNMVVPGVIITGTNFQSGAGVKLTRTGSPDIVGTNVLFSSSTQLTCTFNLIGAAPGSWNVVVTNPDEQTGMFTNGFTVVADLTVSGITPLSGQTGTVVWVTNLLGTNFNTTATPVAVRLVKAGSPDIMATSVVVVSPTHITCQFDLTGAVVGAWDVVVRNPDGQEGRGLGLFTVTSVPITTPTVLSITPTAGHIGTVVSVTNLVGTNFNTTATPVTVRLVKTGSSDIMATNVVVVSSTRITCQFDLTGAATGLWDVVVRNPDGQEGRGTGLFSVTSVPVTSPTVISITPASGQTGLVVSVTYLAGTNFNIGATPVIVRLVKTGSPDIIATNVVVVSSTWITCHFDLTGASAGTWDVVVRNPDGQEGRGTGLFTVTSVPITSPTVLSINPAAGQSGTFVSVTNLVGANFNAIATPVTVRLVKAGSPDVIATNVVVVSSTWITCQFDLTRAATGSWDVVVRNPDGQEGRGTGLFTVTSLPVTTPTVISITPATGQTGNIVTVSDLIGTDFSTTTAPVSVRLTKNGATDISARKMMVVSSTRITCQFDLLGAETGSWDVVVRNPDGQEGRGTGLFTVTSAPVPPPSITSITPSVGQTETVISVTNLAGANFNTTTAPVTVLLVKSGSPDITANNVVVVSSKQITCQFDLTGVATGSWDVVVRNPDGQEGRSAGTFTVTSDINFPPTITSITPSTGKTGTVVSVNNLEGTNFNTTTTTVTVLLVKSGSPDITANNVVVVSSKQITCQFDLTGVVTGSWDVVVRNPDGQEGRGTGLFTVKESPGKLRANFTGSPRSGLPPLEVQFSDTSTGDIISWRWSFGDGKTSSEQSPRHIYERAGVYSVTLGVSSGLGVYKKRILGYIRVG
jgi:hypothetical protein